MKYLICFLISGLVFGCNEKSIINVPLESIMILNKDTVRYEDVFRKTETIFLETNNNCLISKISQLDFYANRLLILDQDTKNIFVFNTNGHFINKIGSIGKGPGEFIRPLKFIINKKDSLLKVFDSAQKKILVYNLYGKFIEEIYLNTYLSSFGECKNGSGYWGYCAGDLNERMRNKQNRAIKFIRFNSKGQEVNAYEGEKVVDNLFLKDCYITSEFDNKISFVEPYSDKIYSLNGDTITPEYHLDFSGSFIPQSLLKKIQKLDSKEYSSTKELNELLNSYIFCFLRFFENDNWIYTFTPFHGTSTLYNKREKKSLTFHKQLYRESDYETFFWPLLLADNKMYSAPNPSEIFDLLRDSVEERYSKERTQGLLGLLKNVKENDNPIIFIYDIIE